MLKITKFEAGEVVLYDCVCFFSFILSKNVNFLDFGDYN